MIQIEKFINDISTKAIEALTAAREFSHGLGVTISTNDGGLTTLEEKYELAAGMYAIIGLIYRLIEKSENCQP